MEINVLLVNVEGNSPMAMGKTNARARFCRVFGLNIPDDAGIGELHPSDALDIYNDLVQGCQIRGLDEPHDAGSLISTSLAVQTV